MCRMDVFPRYLGTGWRYPSIGISMPSIGSVLGNPPTNALESQHVKIVDMFPHHKLCIQLSEEVQRYFPIVVQGGIENHVPSIHSMVFNGWTDAPLNINMLHFALHNDIHPKNSK